MIVILVTYWSKITLMISNDLWVEIYEKRKRGSLCKPAKCILSCQPSIDCYFVGYWSKTSPRLWWSVMICKWKYTRETRWKKFMRTSFLCKPAKCKKMEKMCKPAKCILSCHLLPLLANCSSHPALQFVISRHCSSEHNFEPNLYRFVRVARAFTSNCESNYLLAV